MIHRRYDKLFPLCAGSLFLGIGGRISSYSSAASLYEVALDHFFRGKDHPEGGDQIYCQGHSAPGIYSRAYLERHLPIEKLENYRRELKPGGGLPSAARQDRRPFRRSLEYRERGWNSAALATADLDYPDFR